MLDGVDLLRDVEARGSNPETIGGECSGFTGVIIGVGRVFTSLLPVFVKVGLVLLSFGGDLNGDLIVFADWSPFLTGVCTITLGLTEMNQISYNETEILTYIFEEKQEPLQSRKKTPG